MKPSLVAASFRVGVQTLRFNPLRTVLSTLGVVIGVASLVAVLAIGDGAEAFARDQIARTTDLQTLLVRPTTDETIDGVRIPRTTWPVFSLSDAVALAAALGARGTVAASVTGSARVTPARGGSDRAAIVMGVTADAERRLSPRFAAGRFISESEVRGAARVAVVSSALAAAAGVGPGDTLHLEGRGFRVIGVVAPPAERAPSRAMTVIVPFTVADSAMAQTASPGARDLVVRVANVEGVKAAKAVAERWAAARLGPAWADQISIATSPTMRLDQARQAILRLQDGDGCLRGDLAGGRRARHHECPAGGGHRAHSRDRHSQGDRRAPAGHPGAVPLRVDRHHRRRQRARRPARPRGRVRRSPRSSAASSDAPVVCGADLGDASPSRPRSRSWWDWRSAPSPRSAPRGSRPSTRSGTSERVAQPLGGSTITM